MTKPTTKKPHAADVIDAAQIDACKKFTATILKDNKVNTVEFTNLGAARIEALKLNAQSTNGRRALVYAITADDRAILVPARFGSDGENAPAKPAPAKKGPKVAAPTEADLAAAKAEAAELAKVKKIAKELDADIAAAKKRTAAKPAAKKAAPAKPAAKKAAAPAKRDGSKVATVIAMLTGKKPTTRKAIVEATGWQVDLKALCARKGMKLKKAADGTLSATPPKAGLK